MSTYGYEQEPYRYEQEPYGYVQKPHVPKHRRMTRVLLAVTGVAASLLVSMAAFAGTVFLGGAGGANEAPVASGAAAGVGGEDASPDASAASEAPAAAIASATPSPNVTSSATKPPASLAECKPANMKAEDAVLLIVNCERAKARCQPLAVDVKLAAAARNHSTDMVARHYFSHMSPDGVGMAARITNAGYRWSMIGENIAAGQASATEVMNAWMNSPGHRANILNCRFRDIGIGIAYDGRRRPVWTQDFGSPR